MQSKKLVRPSVLIIAMTISAMANAATRGADPNAAPVVTWSAQTGLGYDSNAFKAPSSSYIDYAAVPAGSNPVINPKAKTGFYIPYEVQVDVQKQRAENVKLMGSAGLDGRFYFAGSANSASEYSINLNGGAEYLLDREGKSANTLYAGAILEKHNQTYVDHDSGEIKTTAGGADISTRYNYMSLGGEVKYKHKVGSIDWGFDGKLLLNNYDNPPGVNQLDHTYLTIGANASIPVFAHARLLLSADHSTRDYSSRHSRDAQGTLANANPLLIYTYDALGVTLRNRFTPEWQAFFDYDYTRRADNFVGYNDYTQSRIGARALFERGDIKGRVSLHHWSRDYPNGFAFDVAGQPAKTYSGNDLKVSGELARDQHSAYWAELVYDTQTSSDLRYDYVRTTLMGGMRWEY